TVPRHAHRLHHAVRADGDDVVHLAQRDRLLTQLARAIRRHALHDVAGDAAILRTIGIGGEAGVFIAAPYDHVGGALDLLDLVAVLCLLVAGEIQHPRS